MYYWRGPIPYSDSSQIEEQSEEGSKFRREVGSNEGKVYLEHMDAWRFFISSIATYDALV